MQHRLSECVRRHCTELDEQSIPLYSSRILVNANMIQRIKSEGEFAEQSGFQFSDLASMGISES